MFADRQSKTQFDPFVRWTSDLASDPSRILMGGKLLECRCGKGCLVKRKNALSELLIATASKILI